MTGTFIRQNMVNIIVQDHYQFHTARCYVPHIECIFSPIPVSVDRPRGVPLICCWLQAQLSSWMAGNEHRDGEVSNLQTANDISVVINEDTGT